MLFFQSIIPAYEVRKRVKELSKKKIHFVQKKAKLNFNWTFLAFLILQQDFDLYPKLNDNLLSNSFNQLAIILNSMITYLATVIPLAIILGSHPTENKQLISVHWPRKLFSLLNISLTHTLIQTLWQILCT